MSARSRITLLAACAFALIAAALVALRTCATGATREAGATVAPRVEFPTTDAPSRPRTARSARRADDEAAKPDPPRPDAGPAVAAPEPALVVEVVGGAGDRVPGAEVVVFRHSKDRSGVPIPKPAEVARGTTGATGEIRFDALGATAGFDLDVRARAAGQVGLAQGFPSAADGGRRLTVQLEPGSEIAGRVVLRDGSPVAGADVVASFVAGRWYRGDWTTTDVAGRFTLPGIPRSSFENDVTIRVPPGPGGAEASVVLRPPDPPREDVVLVVVPTCRVRGRCVDARGGAMWDMWVTAGVGPGHSVGIGKSDANGAFEFDVPRGTWTVSVASNRTEPFTRRDVVCESAEVDVGTLDLPDARFCKVAGRCADIAGRPVANAEVVLGTGPGHSVGWGRTDADGQFEFDVRPGTWAVIVSGAVWKRDVACEAASLELGTLSEPPPPPK